MGVVTSCQCHDLAEVDRPCLYCEANYLAPNVCRGCGEYVGSESVMHRHGAVVGTWICELPGDPPGLVRHTTIGGKGHVGRLAQTRKRG